LTYILDITPAPSTSPKQNIIISIAPDSLTGDLESVSKLADLVNKVYGEAGAGIWVPEHVRTNTSELIRFIQEGHLVIATLNTSSSNSSETSKPEEFQEKSEIIGCVHVERVSLDRGKFGLLMSSRSGGGLGRDLVLFAEDHCRKIGCSKMQCELLVPSAEHASKTRLESWYRRLGYKVVKVGNFQTDHPVFARDLIGPADYKVFEKDILL
jgi:GNAT superfamily N-acetyltransferase